MLKNYFKIALRNISRRKVYTAINILGLAMGICSCIAIYLIASHDLSFDKFHPDKERIYRIVGEMQRSSGEKEFLNSPTSDVAGFENQIPGFEVAAAVHLYGEETSIPDGNNPMKKFSGRSERPGSWQSTSIITGPNYFQIFNYHWLAGNPAASLSQPFQVVLTDKRAQKYFGNIPFNEMIGKKVIYQDSLVVNVSGIVKDWDENTDFGYTDFISTSTATHSFLKAHMPSEDWSTLSPHQSMAFVKLQPGVTKEEVNRKFASFIKKNVVINSPGASLTMTLQPLADIHYTRDFHRGDDGDNFTKLYLPTLFALMGIAFFILIIAVVNYINLSSAQYIARTKEISVRKVLGSRKRALVLQSLVETGILTMLAILLSVMLVNPVLSVFSNYVPQGVSFSPFEPSTLLFLLCIGFITTILGGFYPATLLASFKPSLSLKGDVQKGKDRFTLRKGLIVFQFTISMIFIIAVLVVGKQINFMSHSDKGFNADAVLTVSNWDDHDGKLKIFADEIKHITGVKDAILQGTEPMGFAQNIVNLKFKAKDETLRKVLLDVGNSDFIPFYGMKITAGRNMVPGDSLNELVINEAFARSLGFSNPADAIGSLLYHQSNQGDEKPYPVVGIVADYHTSSFHEAIQPLVIEYATGRVTSVAIRVSGQPNDADAGKATIAQIESQWKKTFPKTPFNYNVLNESIARLFEQEKKTAWLMNVAMGITIFISCMGLFGLGMFTAERRSKEIGIRKVLGATIADVTIMLSTDFIKLILLAAIIASPIAWFFMNGWLQDFAYRTTITWWVFALAAVLGIIIALVTISVQAIKAAVANPVKSLRTE